jgi:hypothetical protein
MNAEAWGTQWLRLMQRHWASIENLFDHSKTHEQKLRANPNLDAHPRPPAQARVQGLKLVMQVIDELSVRGTIN